MHSALNLQCPKLSMHPAPCVHNFRGRVHNFQRGAPGLCTLFHPFITATYEHDMRRVHGEVPVNPRCSLWPQTAVPPVSRDRCSPDKHYIGNQCSKLRFKFVHLPGAEVGKCVHPEFKSCAHRLRYTLNNRENGAHAGCTALKIMHPALKPCTQGAGCTLNFEHWQYRSASSLWYKVSSLTHLSRGCRSDLFLVLSPAALPGE